MVSVYVVNMVVRHRSNNIIRDGTVRARRCNSGTIVDLVGVGRIEQIHVGVGPGLHKARVNDGRYAGLLILKALLKAPIQVLREQRRCRHSLTCSE